MANDILEKAFIRHKELVDKSINLLPEIERGGKLLLGAISNGNKILICGNGGSAADSQHFAAELTCRYRNDRRPLPAIALTVDTSAITAIGNDYSFEKIFSRQIEALGTMGDALVALTTSGRSKNILAAIEQAKKQGMKVIALTGEEGKNLSGADVLIAVPSSETARVQEMHELIYHSWCEWLDKELT